MRKVLILEMEHPEEMVEMMMAIGSDGDPDDSDEETDDTDGARTRRRRGKRRRIINKIVVDTTGFEKALTTLTDGLQTMINKQDTIKQGFA